MGDWQAEKVDTFTDADGRFTDALPVDRGRQGTAIAPSREEVGRGLPRSAGGSAGGVGAYSSAATSGWPGFASPSSPAPSRWSLGSAGPGVPWLDRAPRGLCRGRPLIHARILNARDLAARAVTFYERGLARLEDRWQGSGETGDRFRIDGPSLSRTTSTSSAAAASSNCSRRRGPRPVKPRSPRWLLAPAAPTRSGNGSGRRRIAATPRFSRAAVRGRPRRPRRAWTPMPFAPGQRAPPLLTAAWPVYVLPAGGRRVVRAGAPGGSAPAAAAVVAAGARGAGPAGRMVPPQRSCTSRATWIGAPRNWRCSPTSLALLEREPVTTPRLEALADALTATGRTPSAGDRDGWRGWSMLRSRQNQLFAPIALLLLVGTQCAFAVDRWRARCGPAVPRWLDAIGEYEALAALAGYAGRKSRAIPFPRSSMARPSSRPRPSRIR